MQKTFKVLFHRNGNIISAERIRHFITTFSESYDNVVKRIIGNSITLNRDTFGFNVATLLPSFGMTRRGPFHGLKVEKGTVKDPKHVLDVCWKQTEKELQNIKNCLDRNLSHQRSRVVLELSPETRNAIVAEISEIFDTLEWTTINGSDIGRVGASKILFAVLPELALPVDNAEWDYVFRTHSYGKILSVMIDEMNQWEIQSDTHIETLDPDPPTTATSIYNVMAMEARPRAV